MSSAEFSKKSTSIYYAYIRKNGLDDSEVGRTLFNAGFYLGSQWAIHTSGELSPHIARFMEFIMWIGVDESEMLSLREDDNSSTPDKEIP